jgi:hypothetical protein
MNTHEPLNPQPEPVTLKGSAVITRVAGTYGGPGDTGDGGPATEATLNSPTGLEVIPGGGFLISDNGNNVVRQVSRDGVITRVAGIYGVPGDTGDGGPATEAKLNTPAGVAVIPGGGFLVADLGNNVVRRVSPEGVITRVAGTYGAPGDTGDGGPATEAKLNTPAGVAVIPGGGFLFADLGNNVVRQVSRDGVITRVAGTYGAPGDTGDGGPATEAKLNSPGAMTALPGGGFLISDNGNNVVRRVSPEGVITRVAGTYGAPGDTGDGGPATEAKLNSPAGVAVIPGGGFLISDQGNNVVRQVSPDGVITRVAGTYGAPGDTGDGGLATEAKLNGPGGVGVIPGGFLFNDVSNNVVRKVEARQGGPQSM